MANSGLCFSLRRLRIASGKSQSEVAAAAGLSRVGYRKIEVCEAIPRRSSALAIANVLSVSAVDLEQKVGELQAVRFRASKKMTTRGDTLVRVAQRLEHYKELEELLGVVEPLALSTLRKGLGATCRGQVRAIRAAERVRLHFGLKPGEVVQDICGLLEGHGVKVLTLDVASKGFFGLSVGEEEGGPAVVVNTWKRVTVERWIFTAAHELGHLVLHHNAYDVEQADDSQGDEEQDEKEADVFASHFLMPPELFEQLWEQTRGLSLLERLLKLKRVFRVSWQVVLYRVASQETNRIRREAWWKEARRQLALYLERSVRERDEPEELVPSDFVAIRPSRLVREGLERGVIDLEAGARVLGISKEEMRVRREGWC